MGKRVESLQKNSLTPNADCHNNAIWYTDTDGFLEHSPSGGNLYYKGPTLQKVILVFFLVPPYTSVALLYLPSFTFLVIETYASKS